MPTKEIRQHRDRVASLGCLICESHIDVTLHHCHGGSMRYIDGFNKPGGSQKASEWLIIPIHAKFHTGEYGIDSGMGKYKSVMQWESAFGTQVEFLDRVCYLIGYNVWGKAGVPRKLEDL